MHLQEIPGIKPEAKKDIQVFLASDAEEMARLLVLKGVFRKVGAQKVEDVGELKNILITKLKNLEIEGKTMKTVAEGKEFVVERTKDGFVCTMEDLETGPVTLVSQQEAAQEDQDVEEDQRMAA